MFSQYFAFIFKILITGRIDPAVLEANLCISLMSIVPGWDHFASFQRCSFSFQLIKDRNHPSLIASHQFDGLAHLADS